MVVGLAAVVVVGLAAEVGAVLAAEVGAVLVAAVGLGAAVVDLVVPALADAEEADAAGAVKWAVGGTGAIMDTRGTRILGTSTDTTTKRTFSRIPAVLI